MTEAILQAYLYGLVAWVVLTVLDETFAWLNELPDLDVAVHGSELLRKAPGGGQVCPRPGSVYGDYWSRDDL